MFRSLDLIFPHLILNLTRAVGQGFLMLLPADSSAQPLQSIHASPPSGPARDDVGELGDDLGAAAGIPWQLLC